MADGPQFGVLVIMVAAAMVVGHVLTRLRETRQQLSRLARLEGKVDALLRHADISFDPYAGVAPEVRDALEQGEKIQAIEAYRRVTGAGLKAAKEAVEDIQNRRPALP